MSRSLGGSPRRLATAALLAIVMALVVTVPAHPAEGRGAADDEEQVAVVSEDGEVESQPMSEDERAAREAEAPGSVVERGRTAAAEMAESVPLVGAPTYWGMGHRGAGRVIAVIDTGVVADFGGHIVGQACFSASVVNGTLEGHCGDGNDVAEAFDTLCFDLGVCDAGDVLDADAGAPCPADAPEDDPTNCAHGSAVAAVAARHDAPEGVAPDADVYPIQVFNENGTSADFVDILLALDHVVDMADAGLDIASANLSLSSSATFPSFCDQGAAADPDAVAFHNVIQALEDRGIATTVAAGNDGRTGSIGLPACVSNAVGVGASDLDDEIADFSNRGPTLDLVAPGADEGNGPVDPLDIQVGAGPAVGWAGTSFAAPHAAGAFALVQAEYPKASVRQLTEHLRATGALAGDPKTGGSYPRLRLLPPAQGLPAGLLFPASASVAGTARGAVGDFDGDGFADVLAHAPGSAPDHVSYGRAGWTLPARTYSVGGSYVPLVGNFRGSAADDIVWYAAGSGADWVWTGDSSRTFAAAPVTVNGTYIPLVGDFDGDGYDDIAWYGSGRAFDTLWYGGATGFTSRAMTVNGVYRVVVGDVNGDHRDDILFHGPGTASDALWRGTATRGTWSKSSLAIGGTNALRTGDLDGDGDDDLLLYQAGSGADSIWLGGPGVGGAGATGGFSPVAVSVNGTYLPSIADIDGDGLDDILWYAPGTTGDFIWLGRPSGAHSTRTLSVSGTYTPLLADFDADAGADIVWFQSTTTSTPLWWSH